MQKHEEVNTLFDDTTTMFTAINGTPLYEDVTLVHEHITNILQGIDLHGDKDSLHGLIDSDVIYSNHFVRMDAALEEYDSAIGDDKKDVLKVKAKQQ